MDRNPGSSRPLGTVITPAFNAEKFIAETLDSVLAQTYDNFEIVVADDGSTDRTPEIVKARYPRARYFRQPNGRQPAARNLRLRHARGDMIAFSRGRLAEYAMAQFLVGVGKTKPSFFIGEVRDRFEHAPPWAGTRWL